MVVEWLLVSEFKEKAGDVLSVKDVHVTYFHENQEESIHVPCQIYPNIE